MSLHPAASAGTREALKIHPEAESAEIREIYPGASAADPLRVRTSRTPRWRLFGTETGMATAEYTNKNSNY